MDIPADPSLSKKQREQWELARKKIRIQDSPLITETKTGLTEKRGFPLANRVPQTTSVKIPKQGI